MRRVCPACRCECDDEGDRVSCPHHGPLQAWLVVDEEGELVAAGTLTASWLSPDIELAFSA